MFSKTFYTGFCALSLVIVATSLLASDDEIRLGEENGEIIVKVKEDALGTLSQNQLSQLIEQSVGLDKVGSVHPFQTDPNLQLVKLIHPSLQKAALKRLAQAPFVEFVEPNYRTHTDAIGHGSDDPLLEQLWGLKNFGQADSKGQIGKEGADIHIIPLWNEGITGSKKVVVGVIDTGFDWNHPDLKDNLYTHPGEIADNGVDDDGNGFVDDVHGWNFVHKNNRTFQGNTVHGTHVSGTIGASGNNAVGVVGVNWQVSIMPIKALDASGGTLENAIDAINYSTMMKVHLTSNSWGARFFSQALYEAVQKATKAKILFVAAAGNAANHTALYPHFPSGFELDNVMSVAAIDNQDKLANFSNHGGRTVHVAAPGVNVLSTVPEGKYEPYSGTSMATPHVAGIAALMLSVDPNLSYVQIKDRLITTSEPVSTLRHFSVSRGRVSAWNAIKGIVPPSQDPDSKAWKSVGGGVETNHPYDGKKEELVFHVEHPGARYLRVHFDKIELYNDDYVLIQDSRSKTVDLLTGKKSDITSDYVEGDKLTIKILSKPAGKANAGWGFKVDQVQAVMD